MTRCLVMLLVAALATGCGRDRSTGRETSAVVVDSTLFGDDRARQGDTARTSPDVALLERLVDEYEGLDVVMDALAGPASGSRVQGKAWKAGRHEDAAKGRLLDLLQVEFGERYHPRTPDGAAGTSDSIAALPREAGTWALNALVLDHHRRVAATISAELSTLRSPRVREALAELHESLQEEIRKLGAAPRVPLRPA
ncbi:MAG: hypothetical protein H0T86_11125 [Gemmatimonadales bacterium]|nr:hypothetical protein [Gemmatimonadales bacterium]